MSDRPDFTEPFALLARWRATTPAQCPAAIKPLQADFDVGATPDHPESPEEHLAAIEDLTQNVVPRELLTTFLAPIREALAIPLAERDLGALALDIDRLEDLLEAFLLTRGSSQEVPP